LYSVTFCCRLIGTSAITGEGRVAKGEIGTSCNGEAIRRRSESELTAASRRVREINRNLYFNAINSLLDGCRLGWNRFNNTSRPVDVPRREVHIVVAARKANLDLNGRAIARSARSFAG